MARPRPRRPNKSFRSKRKPLSKDNLRRRLAISPSISIFESDETEAAVRRIGYLFTHDRNELVNSLKLN